MKLTQPDYKNQTNNKIFIKHSNKTPYYPPPCPSASEEHITDFEGGNEDKHEPISYNFDFLVPCLVSK